MAKGYEEYSSEAISEYASILLSIYENYKKKPTWGKLQAMFCTTLKLGYEIGKKEAINNRTDGKTEVLE